MRLPILLKGIINYLEASSLGAKRNCFLSFLRKRQRIKTTWTIALRLTLLFFAFSKLAYSQITFNPSGSRPVITITGNVTGDDLRTFITINPLSGSITDRDIRFTSELRINNNASLTDNNAVYQFPSIFRYAPQSGATVTFTDVTIHYTGTAKSHSYNSAYTANFTRVFYLQGVTSGRSDFFNNGNYTFNMSNVIFVSYGASDFLHFQTNRTLNNITIVNENGGLNFEPGARANGEVEIINNLTLQGITRILGGSGAQGDFKTYDMNWDALNWNFIQRSVDFFFVNPIKPVGWTGYSGSASRVQEFYTHDVITTDNTFNPLSNIRVILANNATETFDYDLITDDQGQLPTQEILKINNGVSLNFDRGSSTLIIPEYRKKYIALTRNINQATVDNIIVEEDTNITVTDPDIVTSYSGININHTTKTITISENHNLCELYDFIKLNKINNISQPSLTRLLVSVEGQSLHIGDYQFILTRNGELSTCNKFLKLISTASSVIADISNLSIGLEDTNGIYKIISLNNIDNASILITDKNTNTQLVNITSFSGTYDYPTLSTSSSIEILITRDGYSNWSVNVDLSTTQDIFQFTVFQSVAAGVANSENQEYQLYLLSKILQKSEGIISELNGTTPSISINNITQPATINATLEQQNEITEMLQRILAKMTAIREISPN